MNVWNHAFVLLAEFEWIDLCLSSFLLNMQTIIEILRIIDGAVDFIEVTVEVSTWERRKYNFR